MKSEKWDTKLIVGMAAIIAALATQGIVGMMSTHSSMDDEGSYLHISGLTEVALITAVAIIVGIICGVVSERHNRHIQ